MEYYEVHTRTPFFLEQLTKILGEPVPISDHVIEGDIEWGWSAKKSSFTVFIDSEGKIELHISNYPKTHPIVSEDITVEKVLKKAKDFKSDT